MRSPDTSTPQLSKARRTGVLGEELTQVTCLRLTLFDLLIQGKKLLRKREVFKHRVDREEKKGSENLTNAISGTPGIPKGFSNQALKRVEELENYPWCLQFSN